MTNKFYIEGFCKTAASVGVDPAALMKYAQSIIGYTPDYMYSSPGNDARVPPRWQSARTRGAASTNSIGLEKGRNNPNNYPWYKRWGNSIGNAWDRHVVPWAHAAGTAISDGWDNAVGGATLFNNRFFQGMTTIPGFLGWLGGGAVGGVKGLFGDDGFIDGWKNYGNATQRFINNVGTSNANLGALHRYFKGGGDRAEARLANNIIGQTDDGFFQNAALAGVTLAGAGGEGAGATIGPVGFAKKLRGAARAGRAVAVARRGGNAEPIIQALEREFARPAAAPAPWWRRLGRFARRPMNWVDSAYVTGIGVGVPANNAEMKSTDKEIDSVETGNVPDRDYINPTPGGKFDRIQQPGAVRAPQSSTMNQYERQVEQLRREQESKPSGSDDIFGI